MIVSSIKMISVYKCGVNHILKMLWWPRIKLIKIPQGQLKFVTFELNGGKNAYSIGTTYDTQRFLKGLCLNQTVLIISFSHCLWIILVIVFKLFSIQTLYTCPFGILRSLFTINVNLINCNDFTLRVGIKRLLMQSVD